MAAIYLLVHTISQNLAYSEVESDCYPLISNGSLLLNPCGLIANTFFNGWCIVYDIIRLYFLMNFATFTSLNVNYGTDIFVLSNSSTTAGYVLDTDGISWYYDSYKKFKQVDGFVSAEAKTSTARFAHVISRGDPSFMPKFVF